MLMGATGKSAQIPLYVWLPDAMEGPTPVSALIHAATMVTAGVYMVAARTPSSTARPHALLAVAVIGTLTAIFAASIGIVQTGHQEGAGLLHRLAARLHVHGRGVAAYGAGIFHLMTHAFFKGCLFLCSGAIIHGLGGEQDMRCMGGLRKYMPWTFWSMTVGDLRHRGLPAVRGVLLERRDPVADLGERPSRSVADRRHRRRHDLVLHVPAVVPDVLRRISRTESATAGHGHDADTQHAGTLARFMMRKTSMLPEAVTATVHRMRARG